MNRLRLFFPLLGVLLLNASAGHAQILLKPKVQEGTKYVTDVSNLAAQTLTIAGMEVKTESDSAIRFTVDVSKRDEQGRISQRTTIESVRSNLMLPGGNVTFDSKVNLAKSEIDQYAFIVDALKAMVGASFTVVVDTDNQFVGVEGLADLVKPSLPQTAQDILKAQFSEARLKKQHDQALAMFPDKPLKPGDAWDLTEDVDLGSGQILKVERRYEYVGTIERNGRTLDKISAPDKKIVSLDVDANSTVPFKFGKTDLQVAMSEGTILFDRQRGQAVDATRVMHIKGKLTLLIANMELPADLDLKIESKAIVQE